MGGSQARKNCTRSVISFSSLIKSFGISAKLSKGKNSCWPWKLYSTYFNNGERLTEDKKTKTACIHYSKVLICMRKWEFSNDFN